MHVNIDRYHIVQSNVAYQELMFTVHTEQLFKDLLSQCWFLHLAMLQLKLEHTEYFYYSCTVF